MNANFKAFPIYKDVESNHPPGNSAVCSWPFLFWWSHVTRNQSIKGWKGDQPNVSGIGQGLNQIESPGKYTLLYMISMGDVLNFCCQVLWCRGNLWATRLWRLGRTDRWMTVRKTVSLQNGSGSQETTVHIFFGDFFVMRGESRKNPY